MSGKVGVFILEGWFVGARTDVDPMKANPGLKRSVAVALKDYLPIFDRLDALWAFEPPGSIDQIVDQRIEQEETLRRTTVSTGLTGQTGMTPAQIRRFIDYFYKDSWQEGVTSPVPPESRCFLGLRRFSSSPPPHHAPTSTRRPARIDVQ